jgi:hypothetical protein
MNPKDRANEIRALRSNLDRGEALMRQLMRVMNLPQTNNGQDLAVAMMLTVFRQLFSRAGMLKILAAGEERFVVECKIAFKGRGDSFTEANYRTMFQRMLLQQASATIQ